MFDPWTDGISTRFTRRVLPGTVLDRRRLPPVVAQCYRAVAVIANLVASLPRAAGALVRGELNWRVPRRSSSRCAA